MTSANVWLAEKTGETRQIFGPYTEARARQEAGGRYALVTGTGLANGQTMPRGHFVRAVESGRIRALDATVLS